MGSEIATFSSVYSDENSVPFAFTSPLYETMLVDDGSLHRYIIPTRHHMGVSEPFSGNPSGDVVFNIIDFDAHNFFRAACKKLGKFFFLHLYASSDISASNKKLTYRFKVEAVFTSHNHSSVTPIRLVNTSEIVVNVIAMHENCPIFTRSFHHFDVPENISIQQSIGKLSTSSSGSSVSAQNLFYIDPVELDIPFRVDLYSGDIFPTRPLNSQYARIGYPEFIHGKSEIELFETSNYTFNVYVASRGGSNRVRCNMVIAARVEISITKFRHSDLSIKVEHLEEITIPGAAGVAYARVYVVGSPSSVGSAIGLRISEPDMREKFELVSTSGKNEWLVQAKYDIHSISLNSWMVITLEAYEIPKVLTKGNENLNVFTSRLSRVKVNIPLVFKSKYKLSLPPEIKIRLSEAAIVNSTIEVLKPSAIFNMTNASFVFTDLRNQHQKSESKEKIRLTKSGSLVVVQPLDLENDISVQNALQAPVNNVIAIPFTVVDGNNLLLSSASESSIIVEVFDINDLDPVVQNNGSVHEVPENVSLNTHVLSVIGYDPDVSHTDLSYVLYDADILPFALIGPRNDELVVSKPLDAETMPTEFIVRILVSDSGIPLPRSVLAVYIIRILDINEHSPVFVEDSCEISLPVTDEGSIFLKAAPSSPSLNIGRYFAEDLDRDGQSSVTIHIAASSFPRPCFKIEEQTGDLNVVCSYLGSPGAQIILNLLASDGIKVSKESCTLSLNLVPFQEVAGTNFTRRCKSSHVYDKLQALKIQKKRYEFLLSQNTVYEPQFNRHRPQFPTDLPTRIHIPENLPIGTVILRFAASDEDGPDYSMAGQIIYGLEALRSVSSETEAATYVTDVDIKQAFLLLPNSGLHKEFVNNTAFCCGVSLVVAAPLDREVISSYSLILHACDLGQPQLCTFSPLHIFLDDLDDNAPEFLNPSVQQSSNVFHISTNPSLPTSLSQDRASGTISVPEDAQPDTILGQVRAVDRDVTSEVRYHLLNFQDVFKIHSRTGKIRLKTKLDRETQAVYELLVSAVGSPRGNHQQSQFKIPYFDFIQVSRAVDYDVRRSANTRVHIIVTDVNDNPPVFYSPGLPQEHQYLYSNSSGITDLNAWLGTDGYVVYVPEDIPEGAYITTLVATDRDEGMNALIRYSLFGKQERSTNCFHTDQMTGVVRLAAGCDLHKSSRSHVLTAWAMDHGASQLYANISFVVHVLSVKLNIFPPRFMVHPALFSGWIRENQPSGSFVFSKRDLTSKLQLKALDAEGSNVIFVIVGGSGFGLFGVNGDGFIFNTREIDAESIQEDGGFWLVIYGLVSQHPSTSSPFGSETVGSYVVSSEFSGPLYTIAELFIEVVDENDHFPVSLIPQYRHHLLENSPANVVIAHIVASDSDKDNLTYVITAGDPQGHFMVDLKTGVLTTTERSLDREAVLKDTGRVELNLVVSVSDAQSNPRSTEISVKVELMDVNDNSPQFVHTAPSEFSKYIMGLEIPFYFFQYYATNTSNSVICVGRIFALDLDAGLNGTVVYEREPLTSFQLITDGGFNVITNSGLICTKNGLPPVGEYRIQVYARDQGIPSLRSNKDRSALVSIRILEPPTADLSERLVEGTHSIIYTSIPPNTHSIDANCIIGQKLFSFSVYDSYDPSGMGLIFELLTSNHSYHHPFAIGFSTPTNLFVYLAEHLEYHLVPVHDLLLIVSNGLEMITTKIEITVKPTIRSSPKFFLHSIVSESVGNINITNLSQAGENSSLNDDYHQHIIIHVNMTESTLIGSLVCRLYVEESGTDYMNKLHYSIMSVEHSQTWDLFTLNENTGELLVNGLLDYETIQHHYILAAVRYSGTSLYSSYATIYVHIFDVNEYAPQFLGLYTPSNSITNNINVLDSDEMSRLGSFTFYVSGVSPVGSSIGCVTAFDPDSSDNEQIVYNIVKGDTSDFFAIEPKTGCITLVKLLLPSHSYSNTGELVPGLNSKLFVRTHYLVVSASDNGTPVSKSNYTQVKIHILPGSGGIDAPAPRFASDDVLYLTVHENVPPNTVLAPLIRQLTSDSAISGFIAFRLVMAEPMNLLSEPRANPNVPINLFGVIADTGLLVTLVQLDRETHGDFHRLVVEVVGTGGIRSMFYDRLIIQIRILDVNDNPPKVIGPSRMTGWIIENSPAGTMIVGHCLEDHLVACDPNYISPLTIKAIDYDVGINAKIVYNFVGSQVEDENRQPFIVDNSTGVLRLADHASLDRESIGHYVLMIEISDAGRPSLTADRLIRISVEVTDVNDSPPIFTDSFYLRSTLFLPTYPTELVLQLTAEDPDLNDFVHYYLVGGDGAEHFTLGEKDGILRVASNSTLSLTNVSYSPFSLNDQVFFLHVEAWDNHKPIAHVSRSNVTIFVRCSTSVQESQTLVIDPVDGLYVEVEEHFAGPDLLKLGQLSVRNSPIGRIYRFITLDPHPGIFVHPLTGGVFATGKQNSTELDRESTANFTMNILVRDAENRFGTAVIHIHLLDINDYQPEFIGLPYYVTFCVGSSTSFNALDEQSTSRSIEANPTCKSLNNFKVTAIDKDKDINGTVVYSLTNIRPRAEPPLLSINSTSGHIYLLRSLPSDWTGRQIEAIVAAIDGGGLSSTAIVNIHLVAEKGPQFSALLYSATVLESVPIGETVTSIETVGINNDASLIYRIVSAKSMKQIPMSSSDLFHDFKEQEPLTLEGCPFGLEFNTGIVRVSSRLDYEVSSHYLLLIEVIDTQTGFAARVNLLINVTDVNDVSPIFALNEYSASISENVPIGYRILTLKAYDPDSDLGGLVKYSLESHNPLTDFSLVSYFKCDPETGDIFVAKQLDFESVREYFLWAVASDQSLNSLVTRVPLRIHILDFNDNPPYFDSFLPLKIENPLSVNQDNIDNIQSKCIYHVVLNERSPMGTIILQLSATDPDINDSLLYRIISVHQNETFYFHLDQYNGILRWVPLMNIFGKPISSNKQININEISTTLNHIDPLGFHSGFSIDQIKIKVEVTDGLHSSTCDVIVNLDPYNWDPPRFDSPKYEWWEISELTTVGSIVNRIQPAKDMDRGKYGQIVYNITGGDKHEWFSIDPSDGTVRLTRSLDREMKNQYSLLIQATDGGGLMDFMKLDISVRDINDNRPIFAQDKYELTLLPFMYNPSEEEVFPMTLPLQLKAYDFDIGENAQIVYKIFSSTSNELFQSKRFSIDSTTGLLLLNERLSPSIADGRKEQLLVEACDSPVYSDPVVLCSNPIQVDIQISNQSSIVLPEIVCTSQRLLEDDFMSERQVGVCDVKPGNWSSRSWHLAGISPLSPQHEQSIFRIDSETGQIFSMKPLNYEIQSIYELNIELHALSYNPTIIVRTTLIIELVDVNDCTPYFDSPLYHIDLPEDYPINVKFLRTSAMDDDADNDQGGRYSGNKQDIITYSLWPISTLTSEHFSLRGNFQDQSDSLEKLILFNPELQTLRKLFKIDGKGWISLRSSLDFESNREHIFQVMATDAAGHWNTSRVHIFVCDVNDNPPYWPLSPIRNDSLEFILPIDLRKRQILSDEIEILENWWPSNDDEIIYQLSIMDPDQDVQSEVKFTLVNEHLPALSSQNSHGNSFFYIQPSGALYLRQPLDRELSSVHVLRFQASDGQFVTQDLFVLRVVVKDANDNIPICIQPDRVITVPENLKVGTILATLNATDSDADPHNSVITYSIKFQNSNSFVVDTYKGTVTLNTSLDFELSQEHEIIVDAADPGGFSCSFNLKIVVLDINDNQPIFDTIEINAIPEDAPLGSLVGKINARDLDSVDTNRLVYSLAGAHDSSFSIESHTGLLRVSRPLDREVKSIHTLTVIVTDGSHQHSTAGEQSNSFTSSATFTIKLLDVNDSPPQFVNTSAHRIRISELAPIGERLTRLKAISQDEGDNAVIHYRLLTKQPEFGLNETTGDLWLQKPLDYEQTSAYFLTIEARDRGQPPLSSTAVLTVHVDDANDNQPQFLGRQRIPENIGLNNLDDLATVDSNFYEYYYAFSVVENSRNGTVVGKLNAIDPDSGDNGRVSFHLSGNIDFSNLFKTYHQDSENIEFLTVAEAKTRFSLDSESGRLILIFQPDREVVSGYWLVVQVEDHGKPNPLSSLTLVYIQILDINDCAPTFEKSNYEFYVEVDRSGNISACSEKQSSYENNCQSTSTGSSGNVLIGRLKLTDSDAHPNSGPFTCHLANSGIIQTTLHDSLSSSRSSATSLITSTTGSSSSTSLFSVRSTEMRIHTSNSNKNDHFNNQTDFSRGECLLYAIDKLPVGSQSLVIRVNDNGLTALHTTTTVTVRIIRMSNLPPEIVNTNSTLIYYRSLYDWNTNYFHESSSKQDMSEQISDKTICRITVKDRTAHDRLFFELLKDNTSMSNLFSVDQYDGTIRPAMKISSNPDTSRSNLYDTSTSRKPILNQFHNSLIHLDSGNYPLRVRVTNGTLTSEATMHIKVIAITEEMLDSSLVIRISNLLPNLFYMENYNTLLQNHLSNLLLKSSSSYFSPSSSTVLSPKNNSSQDENVYILSVQETDFPNRLNSLSSSPSIVYHRKNAFMNSHRNKRSIDRAVDILIAVYDPKEREFIKPSKIAQAISGIADSLSVEFGGEIEAVHDVCTPQFCPRGRCHTKVSIDPNGLMNRIEVHRVNQVSPRFVLSPVCQCPIHFTGLLCNTPTGACALANCPASRLCIPHGLNDYSCICPPPRTGPNCESLLIYGDGRDDCHSESCFNQRENGPLQFTGGTFIHWEFVNPNPFFMELKFSFRTRQTNGPLVFIRWSSLRAFQIRLTNGGHLVISATGLSNGLPITDWLVSDVSIADGHWHRVRFILTVLNSNKATHIDALFHDAIIEDSKMKSNSWNSNSDWWAELTVNGINPQSASINWIPGDSYQQGILVGADLVHGFRPLSEPYKLTTINTAPESNSFPNSTNATPIIFRSGFVGCFRDFTINHIKPPYQINLAPKHSESLRGFSSNPSVLIVRTHKLEYGCQPILTISGSCASGPCLHGGTCVTGSKQSSSSSSYVCDCPSLFHGRHCERTNDACLLAPCYNGGSCQALITSSISKTPAHSGLAAYRCICPAGLSGLHCEIVHPEIISQTSLLSKPLEKSGSTIQSGITCHTAQLILQQDVLNKIQSGTSSNFRYAFSIPSSNINQDSKELVCLHSGSCLDSSSGPQCICPSGWQGARCEYDVDECQVVKSIYSSDLHQSAPYIKWLENRASSKGGLCSPYSSGRGVCFNTPGSYKCNCSIGFSGQHCQSKNLIPLIPDTTILGLSQFHIYITVGLLAFLFLAALTTIVLLACRARGMIGGTLDGSRRSVKSVSSYWPNGGNQQTKPTSRLSDSRLNHLNHSAGGSLSGIPFVAASPAHLNHASHIGTHPRYHMISTSHRRPSLASSTFGYPVAMDESATALLNSNSGQMPFSSESVKLGGNCNAGATLADYADRDDSVSACNSGLVLYPTGVKDQMPVMMMLSPLPGAHGSVGPGNRASVIARYSPASSVVFYGPGVPSGSATPTNQIHSPQPGFCVDSSGSGYIPQHQCFTGSQVAVYPSGHPAFLPHPQSHQQLIQMVNMRPNSVVGSDRLSLGSGSDRFSAHSSQVLLQPNGTGPMPYPNCPQSQALTPQLYYHQPSTPQNQTWTPHLSNTGHNQPGLLIINQNHDDSNLEDACMTLKPQNTDTVKAVDVNKFQSSMKRQSTCDNQTPELTSNNNRKELNQRPVPASIQHTTSAFVLQGRQYSGRQQNNHEAHSSSGVRNTIVVETNGCINGSRVVGDPSPSTHLSNNFAKVESNNTISTSEHVNNSQNNKTNKDNGGAQDQIPNKLDWFGNGSGYHPLLPSNICNSLELNGNCKESQIRTNETSDTTVTPEISKKSLANGQTIIIPTTTKQQLSSSDVVNNLIQDTKHMAHIDDV
uniref:Cadherin n=1 Tax=Schistosoma mansoni TaxID=6183 RepID=A0A5K4FEY1_SCHMA